MRFAKDHRKCLDSTFISISFFILKDLHSLSHLHMDITYAGSQTSERQKKAHRFFCYIGSRLQFSDLFLNSMYKTFGIHCQGTCFVDQNQTL